MIETGILLKSDYGLQVIQRKSQYPIEQCCACFVSSSKHVYWRCRLGKMDQARSLSGHRIVKGIFNRLCIKTA